MSAERAQQLVEAGVWLKLSGDLDGAKRLFEQALKLDPSNAKAKELLASGAAPEVPVSSPSQVNMFNRPAQTTAADPTPMENDWGVATGFVSGVMKMPELPAVAPVIAPAVPRVASSAAPKMPSVNIRIDGDATAPLPFSSSPLFGVPPPADLPPIFAPPAPPAPPEEAADSGIDFAVEDEVPAPVPSPPRPPVERDPTAEIPSIVDVDVSEEEPPAEQVEAAAPAEEVGLDIDVEAVTEPDLASAAGFPEAPPPVNAPLFGPPPPAPSDVAPPPAPVEEPKPVAVEAAPPPVAEVVKPVEAPKPVAAAPEPAVSAPPVFDADGWDLPPEPEGTPVPSRPTMVFGTPLPATQPPPVSSPSAVGDLDLDIDIPVEDQKDSEDEPIDVLDDDVAAAPPVSAVQAPPPPAEDVSEEIDVVDDVEAPPLVKPGSGVQPAPAPPPPPPPSIGVAAPVPSEPPPPPVFDSQVDAAWRWPTPEPFPVAPPDTSPQFPSLKDLPAPMPSPNLAPHAESAWDARTNPGIKLDSIGPATPQQATPIDILASDRPATPTPAAPSTKVDVQTLLRAAKDLLDLDDHSGAMELILKAQALAPNDPEVSKLRERSEATLLTMFESKLGGLEGVPKVVLKDDEIIWLNLDHRAGFVLAQIDGTVSFEDLFAVSGMARLDTARILAQLIDEGVISRG